MRLVDALTDEVGLGVTRSVLPLVVLAGRHVGTHDLGVSNRLLVGPVKELGGDVTLHLPLVVAGKAV